MRKNLFALMVMLGLTGSMSAQDYFHGVGAGYYMINLNVETTTIFGDQSYTQGIYTPGLFYKATLAWDVTRHTMFAVSSYPFVGLNFSTNSQTGVSEGSSLGVEVPILAEFYWGEPDEACFFVSGGGAYGYVASFGSLSIIGPQIGIGGQLEINRNLLGARVSYTYGLNNEDIPGYKDSRSGITFGLYYCLDN